MGPLARRCPAGAAVVLVAMAGLCGLTTGVPEYWFEGPEEGYLTFTPTCTAHPDKSYASAGSSHGTPANDATMGFTIRASPGGSLATQACPGGTYTVQVSFTNARAALMTASTGTFSSPAPTAGCPNRLNLGGPDAGARAANFTGTLALTNCSATGTLQIRVTSAASRAGPQGQWYQGSATLTINPACAVGVCQLPSSPAPSSSSSSAPLPTPSPSASPPPLPPSPTPPAPQNASACTPSTLNYTCMEKRGRVWVHWSVNTTQPPPNVCTGSDTPRLMAVPKATVEKDGTLHMAVEANAKGYVSLAFPVEAGTMAPADIILGWASASGPPFVQTYYVTGDDLDASDATASPGWAYARGVVELDGNRTVLCFSRRLRDPAALASPDLRQDSSYLVADAPKRRRSRGLLGEGDGMKFNWAISNVEKLQVHGSSNVGGFTLDISSDGNGGSDVESESGKDYWIQVHGALMAVAWVLLLPLGTFLPAHKWILGEVKWGSKHAWFWLHIGFQLTGMAVFVAGFVVAFVQLGDLELEVDEETSGAHEAIGIAVMAAAGAQVVLGFVRPTPDHSKRWLWNLLHHNLGRAAVLLAWANVYIGIYLYHAGYESEMRYVEWITPIAVVMGLLVLTDVALRLVTRARAGKAAGEAGGKADVYGVVNGGSARDGGAQGKGGEGGGKGAAPQGEGSKYPLASP